MFFYFGSNLKKNAANLSFDHCPPKEEMIVGVKFRFSEKATKISSVKLLVEDGTIFCGLLRISELYVQKSYIKEN